MPYNTVKPVTKKRKYGTVKGKGNASMSKARRSSFVSKIPRRQKKV